MRYKDPRSRRVIGGLTEASLSAPGRGDATHTSTSSEEDAGTRDRPREPVLEADVVHVMAHEEVDDEAAYEDEDHVESESDDDTPAVPNDAAQEVHVRDVIDDV